MCINSSWHSILHLHLTSWTVLCNMYSACHFIFTMIQWRNGYSILAQSLLNSAGSKSSRIVVPWLHDRAFVIIPIECSGTNYIGDKNRNLGNKAVLLERDGKRDKLFQKIHKHATRWKIVLFCSLSLVCKWNGQWFWNLQDSFHTGFHVLWQLREHCFVVLVVHPYTLSRILSPLSLWALKMPRNNYLGDKT